MNALPSTNMIGIVGVGTMGKGIAQIAALSGHTVLLFDNQAASLTKAYQAIAQSLQKLTERGKLDREQADSAIQRIVCCDSLARFSDCGLIIEAIVENLETKQALFQGLEQVVRADCILASNTSAISITAIAAVLKYPERVVGMHFFNPAPVLPLVEIVSGLATSAAVAQIVYATAEKWGKTPVHTRSTPGFIVNRVARPYYGEALRLLNERAADPATLDAIMRDCGGFAMGPFELMDLIGLDINFAVTETVQRAYFGDPRFTPSTIQSEMVAAGFLGRKSGRGFYDYGEQVTRPAAQIEPPAERPKRMVIAGDLGPARALEERLQASGISITRQPADPLIKPGYLIVEGAYIALTDGRTATQIAAQIQHTNIVLFDLALDYAKTTRIAMARADQCETCDYRASVGLFQAIGMSVTRLDDCAGMAVMRTVAMLANEAADLVNQGIANTSDVDLAMRKGVNYPLGPLTWADQVDPAYIHTVLTHLAQHYGEDRYRISPLLQRKVWSRRKFY